MSKTQEQLFEEWNDELRETQALADLSAWYQTPRKDVEELAKGYPDAFKLYKVRLDEQARNALRKGEQRLISERYECDRNIKANELLRSGKWRIANIAAPIGCGSYTETIDASPVNVRSEKTKSNFWAVLERV